MDIENDLIAGVDALMREAAATHVLPRFGELSSGEVDTKSGPHDLVTVADREAEIAMTPALEEMLPGSVVVGATNSNSCRTRQKCAASSSAA